MTSKRRLNSVLIFDFALVLGFYCLLCMTAVFRFDCEVEGSGRHSGVGNGVGWFWLTCFSPSPPPADKLEDLYTLNFQDYSVAFISYFLALFPVFTLR